MNSDFCFCFFRFRRVSECTADLKTFLIIIFCFSVLFFCDGTAELKAFRDSLIEKAVELMGLNHH